jgi:hypothetical protein
MAKYFDKDALNEMNNARQKIFAERERIYKKYKIDILDTDALSSLSIHEVVSEYDPDFNVNFSRNGEDAKSNGTLVEHKSTRVEGPFTRTGKPRKNAGLDAAFLFHAMGDLDHPRYLFVAKNKDDLKVTRVYDISSKSNKKLVLNYLLKERDAWLERGKKDSKKMKRDIIAITEKFIVSKLKFPTQLDINGCTVFKD